MANLKLLESAILEAPRKDGKLSIRLITPGWGSSGYYSPQVLENAAREKVFAKGTHMFFDHPSESERQDRPERSVRDLAAVLTEDAYISEGGALDAKADVIGPYRELFSDKTFCENIGTSIAAYADSTIGEAEGRKGTIMTALTEAVSVDFVTRAGRGGKVLAALESQRGMFARERSSEELRDLLQRAVTSQFGGDDRYPWLVDYDPEESLVWYRNNGLWQASYSQSNNGEPVISDDKVEVRQVAHYIPLTNSGVEEGKPPAVPAGLSDETQESEEDDMPQIEEGRLAQLEEDAGRVPTLEAERDAEKVAKEEADRGKRNAEARADALNAILESGHSFTKLEVKGLLSELPVTESGDFDSDKFAEILTESAEGHTQESPVRGFGEGGPVEESEEYSADAFDKMFQEV